MIKLGELQRYLDDFLHFDNSLDPSKIDPHLVNGLQVQGKEEVGRVGLAVSASLKMFEMARGGGCDAVIVHHSVNLPPHNRYDQVFQARMAFLLQHEISLFGYHFLLDAHPEVGHNVAILKKIGAEPIRQFVEDGAPWGWVGEMTERKTMAQVRGALEAYFSKNSVWYTYGPDTVRRVVALSGKGAPYASGMQRLLDDEIDLFITGEAHEWNRELFREVRINFVAGGHYNSEVLGMVALQERIEDDLDVETAFIDLPNPV